MNSYIFGSYQLRHSILLTILYSLFALSMFSNRFTVAVAAYKENDVGEREYHRIQKRVEPGSVAKDVDGTAIATRVDTVPSGANNTNSTSPDKQPLASGGPATVSRVSSTNKSADPVNLNSSFDNNKNKTESTQLKDNYDDSIVKQMSDNKEMLFRTLYVTLGITGIIIVYFVARAIWLRQKRTKSRKYRIIAQNGDQKDLEMEPLGDGKDDEDEDYTVFEVNGRKK